MLTSFPPPTGVQIGARDLREVLNAFIVRSATGLPRGGIFPRHRSPLVVGRSDMSVSILPFEGAAVRDRNAVWIANDNTESTAALPVPQSNKHIVIVYAKQNDREADSSDADNSLGFFFVKGEASANPVEPTLPPGALPLARVTIPYTATSTLSQNVIIEMLYPFTSTGGPVWVRNQAERDAFDWSYGQQVLRLDNGAIDKRTRFDETELRFDGQVKFATVRAPHWVGEVSYVLNNRSVTVSGNLTKGFATWNADRWTADRIAEGLPPVRVPASGGGAVAFATPVTNQNEFPGYQLEISNQGVLDLVSRWSDKQFGNGGWMRFTGVYISEPSGWAA